MRDLPNASEIQLALHTLKVCGDSPAFKSLEKSEKLAIVEDLERIAKDLSEQSNEEASA